ncbi:6-phosphogluconolactonase [Coralloluteibacterium stylophorae]|uniref:6-phosphogluconolactonase n=1 Tax=Coralloluteibacterium stylophorae TaxID=1776034 RepID=A0A8J7VTZ1_9GAMM|nr:6-phosphogluconolactonase [Coralloluteibacterium stylophorae]
MSFRVDPAASDYRWTEFRDVEAWAEGASDAIVAALAHAVQERGGARLLLSGGGTPAPVYRALPDAVLDWSKVRVGLVDERASDAAEASNALLVRETLLRDGARAAVLEPLHPVPGDPPPQPGADLVAEADARHRAADAPPLVAVFGMGDDGHTASLFPHGPDLADALDAEAHFVRTDASAIAGARGWPRRITLTPAGWRHAAARILLLRGDGKRRLFGRALESGDVAELPVRALFAGDTPLHVYWCP